MTQDPYDSFVENIPAYVLGALRREEAAALQAHLETCQNCQVELEHYQQVSDGLLGAVFPLQTPPAAVKGRLLNSLESRFPAQPRSGWRFRRVALGAIALALIGMNLVAFLHIRDLCQQQTRMAAQIEKNHTILGMLSTSTEIHPISGDGFSGNLLLDREKNLSFLLVWNLPLPPEDRVYQIWLVSPEGERTDAGLFRPESDRPFTSAALTSSRNLAEFVGIEVTLEPLGGSDTPTGQQIIRVDY